MRTGIGIYVKRSAEAVKLYCEAFGLTLGYHVLNADGSYFHSELMRDETELLNVMESSAQDATNNVVQLYMILDSEAEVRQAYALLSRGGEILTPIAPLPWSPCAATVRDRFGVWWYLSAPQHYPAPDYDPAAPWQPEESSSAQ